MKTLNQTIITFANMLIIALANLLIISSAMAQIPEKMSYQAVIRDAGSKLIQNKQVSMRLSILQGSLDGTSIYSETQNPATNSNGLISIEYGGGAGFSTIKWENGPFFLKTETDPNGGTNFNITGTSQLLSVPYAFRAKTVESITETDPVFKQSVAAKITAEDTTYWNSKQDKLTEGEGIEIKNNVISATGGGPNPGDGGIKVGDYYQGGVVAWVNDAGTHGLILAMVDQSAAQAWSNIKDISIGDVIGKYYDGLANSNAIVAQSGHTDSAAKLCLDYTNVNYGTGVYSDWYLPSKNELLSFTPHLMKINYALINDNNPNTTATGVEYYWSSTEYTSNNYAWYYDFYDGSTNYFYKSSTRVVRAVRAF